MCSSPQEISTCVWKQNPRRAGKGFLQWGVINEVLTESKLMPNFRAIRKLTRAEAACVDGVGVKVGRWFCWGTCAKWHVVKMGFGLQLGLGWSSIVSIYALWGNIHQAAKMWNVKNTHTPPHTHTHTHLGKRRAAVSATLFQGEMG